MPDDASQNQFRLAIVGAGKIAHDHISAIQSVPELTVTSIVDRHYERAEYLARLCGTARPSTDLQTALRSGADGVLICTSTESHAEIAVAALNSGLSVMVEKPAALTLADLESMINASRRNSRPLLVGQTARFQSPNFLIANQVQSGSIGLPRLAHLSWYAGHVWPNGWRAWQFDMSRAGGHILHNGIHAIDLLTWIFAEPPVQVFARQFRSWAPGMPTPDSFHVAVEFASGALGLLEVSYALRTHGRSVRKLSVIGSTGMLGADSEREPRIASEINYPLASTEGALTNQARHFRDVLQGISKPLTRYSQIRWALAAALAARQSLESGQPERVMQR